MKNYIIYKSVNNINGKIYIGKTVNNLSERKRKHKADSLKLKSNIIFHRAIRKYGFENFTWEIICETDSKTKLSVLEKFYIAGYRKMYTLYNMTDGGEGSLGYIHSAETRKKMSSLNKGKNHPRYGKPLPVETRKKISDSHKGKIVSQETRKRLSESHMGQIILEETRLKISKGNKNKIVSKETGNKISESKKGKLASEETKKKLSESHIGKIATPETKLKMSEAQKKRRLREISNDKA